MEFTAVVIFLVFYFVHPQDWVSFLAGLNIIKPVIFLGFVGLLQREVRKPKWGWMRTPHEWLMVVYLLHGIWIDPDWWDTIEAMLPLASFYFLTSQALTDETRLDKFFTWWAGCIAFMCVIGVLTVMGVDITGARELIDGQIGRLCLNSWLLDNPNALGHTAVTAFPLIYFAMIFRRDIGPRLLAIPLLIVVAECVIATESKGAYIAGAAAIGAALVVGRTFLVQISVAALLFIAGSLASNMLPRMADPEAMRLDEGVMGRALAFEAGRTAYETAPYGWNRFVANIKWEGEEVSKSTHSSIVQVGADQGPVGLFLYLSILGLAARSLLTLKTDSDDLERCRRLLFALIVGYFASGWMINRSYHTEFFLLAGAVTAFHKLAHERIRKDAGLVPETTSDDENEEDAQETLPTLSLSIPDESGAMLIEQREAPSTLSKLWNRYGVADFLIGYALFAFSLWLWDYLIAYFLVE